MAAFRKILMTGALLAVATLTSGCSPYKVTSPAQSFLDKGWNCLATPSGFDSPGVIFRVTSDGTKFTVVDFSAQASAQTAQFPSVNAQKTATVSASVVAQLIGLPVSANVAAGDNYTVTQIFGNAQELDTTDDHVSAIIDQFYARHDLDGGQRYYLVRRSVTAKSVSYDFDKDISASLGADVSLKVVQIKPSASYTNTGKFHYQDAFDPAVTVCIVAQQLPVPRPAPGLAAPPPAPSDNLPLFSSIGK